MTVTTEILPLEGIDTEGSPPCQVYASRILGWFTECGKPAAFRIVSTCPVHGEARIFICASCRNEILAGSGWCSGCRSRRGIDGYC